MPLGKFSSFVWFVLLILLLMNHFPTEFYCSCSSTPLSSSPSSTTAEESSQSEQHSAAAVPAATIPTSLCHNSIDTSNLISNDCVKPAEMKITGEINEGPGPPSCPVSCSDQVARGRNEQNSSCYRYLEQKDCEKPWLNDWSEIRLRHCCEHSARDAVAEANKVLSDQDQCKRHVNKLLELDAFVAKVTCQFRQVLLRYDCLQKYSVNDCGACRDAYRRWVCASLIPHWRERHKIKPCRSICHTVEQTCPWFLPADKIPGYPMQYAGEPIFQCIDSNIPETGGQLLKSTHGSGCCYEYCEQRLNVKASTSNFHQVNKSEFPHTRVVSCLQGCNDSKTDPSDENVSTSCENSRTTMSRGPATNPNKNNNAAPSVNFPLSSCPYPRSSTHTTATGSGCSSIRRLNEFSNTIVLWFILAFLMIVNNKFSSSGTR